MQAKQFRLFVQGWEIALYEGLVCRLEALEGHELTPAQNDTRNQMLDRLEDLVGGEP